MTRLSLIPAAFLAMCSPAHAQQGALCGPAASILAQLAQNHGEEIAFRGLAGNGTMALVFANPETGSWTWLVVRPDGVACLALAGEGFEALKFSKPGEPS